MTMASLKTETAQIIPNLLWSWTRTVATSVIYVRRLSKRYDAFRQNHPLLIWARMQDLPRLLWIGLPCLGVCVCRQISWGHTCPYIQTRRTLSVTIVRLHSEPKALWFDTTDGTQVHGGLRLCYSLIAVFCMIFNSLEDELLEDIMLLILFFPRWAALPV